MRLLRLSLLVPLCCAASVLLAGSSAVRQRIDETLHIPAKLAIPESKKYGDFSPASGVTADRVSYATSYNLRVPAIVYRSSSPLAKRGPALIIVNGHGGDKSSWYAYWAGILYARAGAVVLTYDPIGEFERNHLRQSGSSQHDELLLPEDMGRRMGGLMVDDIRQAVSYLRTRKDVDRGRIAVLGYSMGSFITSLACAVETRLHACVLVGGGDLDGVDGYWDSSGRKMCQAIPYQSLKFLGDRGAAIFALQSDHCRTLIWNGSADKVVEIPQHSAAFFKDLQQKTRETPGVAPKNLFEFGFTPAGGHRPYFLTRPVVRWLAETMRFPNLTVADVDKMPETHISEWAARFHLAGAGFRNEENEGGTLALGEVTPVNRDLLRALPESVWEAKQDRYVYETWVDHARAALRAGAP